MRSKRRLPQRTLSRRNDTVRRCVETSRTPFRARLRCEPIEEAHNDHARLQRHSLLTEGSPVGEWPMDPEYRQATVDVFPYVVFYRVDEVRRTLVIVAIAHTRREAGYWKTRLEP